MDTLYPAITDEQVEVSLVDIRRRLLGRKIESSSGWDKLIAALNIELTKLDSDYRIDQIKEKFGGLRYYITPSLSTTREIAALMQQIIFKYEDLSFSICEICGESGEVRNSTSWIRVLCEEHERIRLERVKNND